MNEAKEAEVAVCTACGSTDLVFDATARWDLATQKMAYQVLPDNVAHCKSCEASRGFRWIVADFTAHVIDEEVIQEIVGDWHENLSDTIYNMSFDDPGGRHGSEADAAYVANIERVYSTMLKGFTKEALEEALAQKKKGEAE